MSFNSQAIKARKEVIERLRTTPPTGWTAEYVKENIQAIESQIKSLEEEQ